MSESNSTAPKSTAGQDDIPEDVATLYSWANLHGAKYRDFSASRAQAREEARLRVEEALAEEKRRQEEEEERKRQEEAQLAARLAAEAAEAARQAEAERLAEIARQAEAERQAVLAAQEAQRQAAQRAWQPAPPEAYRGDYAPSFAPASSAAQQPTPQFVAQPANSAPNTAQSTGHGTIPQPQRTVSQPNFCDFDQPGRFGRGIPSSNPPEPSRSFQSPVYAPTSSAFPEYPAAQYALPQYQAEAYPAPQQESYMPLPWHPAEKREPSRETQESAAQPAWLAPELPPTQPAHPTQQPIYQAQPQNPYAAGLQAQAPSAQTPIPMYAQAPGQGTGQGQNQNSGLVDDTLFGSRDRIANRWYALKSVFDPQAAPVEQAPVQPPARIPVLAVFSLAGGVGKTSLVASLGRALSSRGERVLLVDTAAYGLLPFFFGARDQRPGMLRTFNPPGISADAPIQLVTFDPEGQAPEHAADLNQSPNQDQNQDWLAQEVGRYSRSSNRILIDLPTASGSTTRRVLRLAPVVLVPVLPDMNSVVSVGAIEAFFRHNGAISSGGKPVMPYYVLNQFDYSLPLHLDVREILREQIGDRLLPFALRRSPAVSEALAEGMTVMDYAPNAVVAEDYTNLAGWVRGLSAPATQTYRGVRWSER